MFNDAIDNRVIVGLVLVLTGLFGLLAVAPLAQLIVFLNGFLIGSLVTITIAYWKIIMFAIRGATPYTRVRQMALGFYLGWIAIACFIASSVYTRSAGIDVNSNPLSVSARYFAIVAAWLQVNAPDFSLGTFFGRDRKILWISSILGIVFASMIIYAQQSEILANVEFLKWI